MALLLTTGVLAVLGLLALTFATLARLERSASLQRVHASRAALLARSGLEEAAARLDAGQDPEALPNRFLGEDRNANGGLDPDEAASEVLRRGHLDTGTCPAGQAQRPSFWVRGPGGLPAQRTEEGRDRGLSSAFGGGALSLKVSSGGIFVNGGDPALPATEGYNAVLRRILGTLAEALDREDGLDDGLPVDGTDGWALVDRRPAEGWRSPDGIPEALRPFLALEAEPDLKVIRPNASAALQDAGMACRGDWAVGRAAGAALPTRTAPDFERMNGRIVGRAPVDLAWARTRRPVLIALLAGLEGLYLQEGDYAATPQQSSWFNQNHGGDFFGTLRTAALALDWNLPTDDCRLVADRLLACTAPLDTRQAFDAFCDALPFAGPAERVRAKRDLIKANFDPNSLLNKSNPDRSLRRTVDKMDLLGYSTEFSLSPSSARDVACAARVSGPDGRVLAARTLSARLPAPRTIRITTQAEFACADLGDPRRPGDESSFRTPGDPLYISGNAGLPKGWGHRLGAGPAGASLQTYPEPCTAAPAAYDGSLRPATIETPDSPWYGVTATTRDLGMLAGYDDSLDLDLARSGDLANLTDALQVAGGELGNGLLPPPGSPLTALPKLNTLLPDGCYVEQGRTPGYHDRGSLDPWHGVFSFWVKRNYDFSVSMPRGHQLLKWINFMPQNIAGDPDQAVLLVDGYWLGAGPAALVEMNHIPGDSNRPHPPGVRDIGYERYVGVFGPGPAVSSQAHRWSLLTMRYDIRNPSRHAVTEIVVDGGFPANFRSSFDLYSGGSPEPDPTLTSDITLPDLYGPHRIFLGDRSFPGEVPQNLETCLLGTSTDATIDEFAAYDFGGSGPGGIPAAGADAVQAPSILAAARFTEGRYVQGWRFNPTRVSASPTFLADEAPGWYGPALRLPEGAVVEAVEWTFRTPAELPDDFAEIACVASDGASYLWGAQDSCSPERVQSWKVGRVVPGPFRLQALFRRAAALPPGTPVLDAPALDDVTVRWRPAGGPFWSSWTRD